MAENSYSFKNPFKKTDIILKEKKEASQLSFDICNIVSALLTDICEEGKHNIESKIALLKPFISRKIPTISIKDFIDRLLKYSKAFKEIIIIILIYLDNICAKNKINLNYYNIHKLIFGAFISAVKFYEDHPYSMKYYAKLGGISIKEALVLEYEFMSNYQFRNNKTSIIIIYILNKINNNISINSNH